ncbi:hypothetical protein HDU98_010180 [Podochytrium sp. JEL0797]|nr:hypothetical protein HDU98_010180 [Podochytrium sp. JEL0797]
MSSSPRHTYHQPCALLALPTELLQHIALSYLDAFALLRFARTSRVVYNAILIPRAASFVHRGVLEPAAPVEILAAEVETPAEETSTSELPTYAPTSIHPLTVLDAHGLGLHLCYDPSKLAASNNWALDDEVWDSVEDWEVPGIYQPVWAIPSATFPAGSPQTPIFVPGTIRINAKRGMRYKVSASATSRIPLPLLAKKCIPNRIPYYEVTFGTLNEEAASGLVRRRDFLDAMVGLVSPDFLTTPEHHSKLPSNEPQSVAYESVYGMTNLGGRRGEGFQFGPSFTFGDTIGCGIISASPDAANPDAVLTTSTNPDAEFILHPHKSPPTATIFFTKNGHWIGDAPLRVSCDMQDYTPCVFPSVGVATSTVPVRMAVNLGQRPFVFDMGTWVKRLGGGEEVWNHVALREVCVAESVRRDVMEMRARCYSVDVNERGGDVDLERDSKQPVVVRRGEVFGVQFKRSSYIDVWSVQSAVPLVAPRLDRVVEGEWRGYFEVTIKKNCWKDVDDPNAMDGVEWDDFETGFLGIGLALRPFSAYYHVGWDFGSFAYHSDDGKLFDGAGQGGFEWGDPYGVGDVVGCGITVAGDVYFTKNGVRVGPKRVRTCVPRREGQAENASVVVEEEVVGLIPASLFEWKLHPTVSACQMWEVELNFGERDFVYKGL